MRFHILSLCALSASLINASPIVDRSCPPESGFQPEDVIERDVLIIGGGATGTFAAVSLADKKKSVLVVECRDKLGGHVDTFRVPGTGAPIDYGVQAYIENNETKEFFKRFDVTLNASALSTLPSKIVDFKTGDEIPNATAPDPTKLLGPLADYLFATLEFPFLAQGAYDIPKDVPDDLLMPFGDFITKHKLQEVVPVVWIFAQGVGNLLETPTLYVLQNFGQPHLLGLLAGYLYAPDGNQVVYDRAGAFLADNVLYSSSVIESNRTDEGVTAVVQTPTGQKLIKAKKMLITIPPTVKNLAPFDLDQSETSVFSQWQNVPYFVGIVENDGLPILTNFLNVDPTEPDGLPQTPFVWRLETTGIPGYQTVKVIGEPDSKKSQELVIDAVRNIETGANETVATGTDFAAWREHADLQLHVSTDAIKAGFYNDLYALQGKRSTFYTGNAWCSDYSPLLWAFTEQRILPRLLL